MKDPAEWAFWVQIPPTRGMRRVTLVSLCMVTDPQRHHVLLLQETNQRVFV